MLCHDITQIIKGEKKGPVFRKGHIIREEDVEVLLSVGKDHIYIWEVNENMLHENEAALMLYDMCKNEHLTRDPDIKDFLKRISKIEKEYAYVPLLDSQKLEKEPLYVTIFTGNQKNRLYNQIEKEYPLLDIPKMKKEPLYTTKFIENKEIKYRVYDQIERKIKEINDKFKTLISFDKLENQQGSFVLPYVLKPSYSDFEYIDSEYLIVTMGKYFYVIDLKKVEMEHKEVDEDILKLLEIMKMLKF